MAAAGTRAGTGYVDLEPQLARDFHETIARKLNEKLTPALKKVGDRSGKDFGKGVASGIDRGGIAQMLKRRFARIGDDAGKELASRISKGAKRAEGDMFGLANAVREVERRSRKASAGTKALGGDMFGIAKAAREAGKGLRFSHSEAGAWTRRADGATKSAGRLRGRLKNLGYEFGSLAKGLRTSSGGFSGFDGVMARVNRSAQFFRNILRTIKWPVFVAGLGLALQGLSAFVAGVVAATGALGSLSGALIALPAAALAGAQAFGALKLATAGVGDAVKAALDAEVQGGGQAVDVMKQQKEAAERVADAKRNLTDTQERAKQAQEDLTDARESARRSLQDMRLESERSRDSEEGATLQLVQARKDLQKALKDPESTGLDVRFAEEALDQARYDLRQTRIDAKRAREDYRKAEQGGVKQMPEVVAAEEAKADAKRAVADADRDLKKATEDASEAMKEQGSAASAFHDKMSQLPPAGQKFVRFLVSLKPKLDALRATSAQGFFPGAEVGLKGAMKNFGVFRGLIGGTSKALGGLAARAGQKLGSAVWGKDLARLGKLNTRIIDRLGGSLLHAGDAFRHVLVAAEPFLDWLSEGTEEFGEWLAVESAAGRESGKLAEFFDRTRQTMERVWPILKGVGGALGNIGEAARPLGNQILDSLGDAAEGWRKWTGSVEGQNELAQYFSDAKPAVFEMGRLLRDATKAFFELGAQKGTAKLIGLVRTKLLPTIVDLVDTLTGAFGEAMVNTLTNVVRLLGELSHSNGPLVVFVRTIGFFSGAIADLLKNNPALHSMVTGVVALVATVKAASFLGAITGFQRLSQAMIATTAASQALGAGSTFSAVASQHGAFATGMARLGQTGAGKMAMSFGRFLGPAFAALGLSGIIMAATKGDWAKAGVEAGGALLGGVAGFLVGGPMGALVGVGAGSLLGGALSGLFDSTKELAPIQDRLNALGAHAAKTMRQQAVAADSLTAAQKRLRGSKQREKAASEAVADAQRKHTRAVRQFGPDSLPALKAALQLARAQRREADAAEAAKRAHKLSGIELELFKNRTVRAYAAERQRIPILESTVNKLTRRWRQEKSNVPLQEQLEKRVKELGRAERTRDRLLEESAQRVGPKFAQSLQRMTVAQATWGKGLRGLVRQLPELRRTSETTTEKMVNNWGESGLLSRAIRTFRRQNGERFQSFAELVREADQNIADNTKTLSDAFGGSTFPTFTLKKMGGGEQKKQSGGFIVPGTGSGDTFRTALPVGSGILNREATAAFGFQKGGLMPVALEPGELVVPPSEVKAIGPRTFAAMNAAVPRFQKGGVLGKEPKLDGPTGALRDLGQGAIKKVYDGAKSFLDKHKPKGLFGGFGGPSGLGTGGGDIVTLGKKLQQMGYEIGEHPAFGGVAPVHTTNSAHYSARALDINDDAAPYGHGSSEMSSLDWLAAYLKKLPHSQIIWRNRDIDTGAEIGGHMDHLHFAMQRGGLLGLVQKLRDGGFVSASQTQKNVALRIAKDLLGYGLNYKGAAGIIGNAWRESLWNPASEGTGGGGLYGFTASPISLADLKATAGAKGVPWTDITFQDNFMWNGPVPGSRLKGALNSQRTAADAAELFDTEWEKSGVKAMSDRKNGAREAMRLMVDAGMGGAAEGAAGAASAEKIPPTFMGAQTAPLQFGALPKNLEALNAEITKWTKLAPTYLKAKKGAEKKGKSATAERIGANHAKIQERLRLLSQQRVKLRVKKVREKLGKRLGKALGRFGDYEQWIEAAGNSYSEASQDAEQIVSLEPVMEELPSNASDGQRAAKEKEWVDKLTAYVNTQERPAFTTALERAADWRNTILRAQSFGFGKGLPSVTASSTAWETDAWKTRIKIDQINELTAAVKQEVDAFWSENAKKKPAERAKDLPDWLKKRVRERDKAREELPALQVKDTKLTEAITKARELFFPGGAHRINPPALPLPGSGSLENTLRDIQGMHQFPKLHELLSAGEIGEVPIAGRFGGEIWNLQETFKGLGLKLSQAENSIAGPNQDGDRELAELTKELLRRTSQREAVEGVAFETFRDFEKQYSIRDLPEFHSGGVVPGPANREVIAKLRGQEGVFTPEQMDAMGEAGPGSMVLQIDQLVVHEDGTVTARMGDKEVRGIAREVVREETRESSALRLR